MVFGRLLAVKVQQGAALRIGGLKTQRVTIRAGHGGGGHGLDARGFSRFNGGGDGGNIGLGRDDDALEPEHRNGLGRSDFWIPLTLGQQLENRK